MNLHLGQKKADPYTSARVGVHLTVTGPLYQIEATFDSNLAPGCRRSRGNLSPGVGKVEKIGDGVGKKSAIIGDGTGRKSRPRWRD